MRQQLFLLFALAILSMSISAQSTRPAKDLKGARNDIAVKTDKWAAPNTGQNDTVFIAQDDTPGAVRAFLYHRQGVVKETGVLVNGKKEGEWRRYYSTGMPEQYMSFKADVAHGGAYSFFPNGFIKIEANFKDGKKEGYFRTYSQVAGKSTLKSEALYKADQYHGTIVQYMENGNRMQESSYKNGVKEGIARWYYSNDKVALEQEYKNGQLEGRQTAFFESGQPQTISNHVNNELHGDYENYFESGQLESKGTYVNGKRSGKWQFYKEDGSPLRTEEF